MTTPYEDLGLEPSATADEIRTAYRRLAMKHHPDRNGDPVEFKRVKNAYEVLSDPERRLQYDTTGTTEQGMSIRQAAETLITQVAMAVVQACPHPELFDLKFTIIKEIEECQRLARNGQRAMVQDRDRLKKALKRFKRKNGENMIVAALQERIDGLGRQLDHNTNQQLLFLEVLEVLGDYSYTVGEEPEPEVQLLEKNDDLVHPV